MALSIKDAKTDRLARKVARLAGESITEAVSRALEERLSKLMVRRKNSLACGGVVGDRTPLRVPTYSR